MSQQRSPAFQRQPIEHFNHEGTKTRRKDKEENANPGSSSCLRAFVVIPLTAIALLTLPSAVASAHAFLDHAEPKVGQTVKKSPGTVEIWFTQQPEHAFSTIQVFDADGKEVQNGKVRTDPKDEKALIVAIPENLPPGTYKVVWKVLSVDTHRSQGDFKFTIKP